MNLEKVSPPEKSHDYWCFISYRHSDNRERDRAWASWLHQEIEEYTVPPELVGEVNARGDSIPEQIYPVFRDEESLPVDSNLSGSIGRALDASRFLVVLCSPRAVESRYVYEEIVHYKALGRDDRIIAAIIDGEPGHPDEECFPPPVVFELDGKGQLNFDRPIEPIAADFRLPDGSEGYTSLSAYRSSLFGLSRREANDRSQKYGERLELMTLKIIAGILGLPLERLRQRDSIYRLREARKQSLRMRAWLTAVGILALAAMVLGLVASIQRNRALEEAHKNRLLYQVTDARERLSSDPVSGSRQILDIAYEAEKKFRVMPPTIQAALFEAYQQGRELRKIQLAEDFPPSISFTSDNKGVVLEFSEVDWSIDPPAISFRRSRYDIAENRIVASPEPEPEAPLSTSDQIHDVMGIAKPKTQMTGKQIKVGVYEVQRDSKESNRLAVTVDRGNQEKERTFKIQADRINCWKAIDKNGRFIAFTGHGMVGDADGRSASAKIIRVWTDNGNSWGEGLVGHSSGVWDLTISRDESLLASVSEEGELIVWDLEGMETPLQFGRSRSAVGESNYGICVKEDASRYATVGYYGYGGIFESETGVPIHKFKAAEDANFGELKRLSENHGFVAPGAKSAMIFNWEGELIRESSTGESQPKSMCLSSNGEDIFWIDSSGIHAWPNWSNDGGSNLIAKGKFESLLFTSDDQLVAFSAEEAAIVQSGSIINQFPLDKLNGEKIKQAAGGNDLPWIVMVTEEANRGAKILSIRRSEGQFPLLHRIPFRQNISSIEILPWNTDVAVGLMGGSIEIWNLKNGAKVQQLTEAHTKWVGDMEMDPSGQFLFTTGGDSSVVRFNMVNYKVAIRKLEKRLSKYTLQPSK